MTYMMDKGYNGDYFRFGVDGYLECIEIDEYIKINTLRGKPFEVKGCKDCNRPYCNTNKLNIVYNYSRKLTKDEIKLAIKEMNLDVANFGFL
ncbi:hypothetical protein QJS64_00375 [Paraclostridium bifermentans]|uniref:Uncharacterized protein n=1 Tax=Paraclostridium bifermentans TaxID=1490 RepID=A0ABY8R344_PARBF|nr:hypothetical protein QJS64_00375 [Paraclostridium bifermentans]